MTVKQKDWLMQYQEEMREKPRMGEIEWRSLFIEQVIKRGLNWPSKQVRSEKDCTDIRLLDEKGLSYAVIETKISDKVVEAKKTLEQAQKYLHGGEAFFCLASPQRIRMYSMDGKYQGEVKIASECEKESVFYQLRFERLAELPHMEKFRRGEAPFGFFPVDRKHPENFEKFVRALQISASLLKQFAELAWNKNQSLYAEYRAKCEDISKRLENLEKKKQGSGLAKLSIEEQIKHVRMEEFETERKYRGPREIFERHWPKFHEIQPYSRDVGGDEKELLQIYLTDVSYIALCRILFIRICEDKGLIRPKISNGGLKAWTMLSTQMERSYPDLLKVAYAETSREVYAPLFEGGMFDWYAWENGLLSETLERIFFLLNSFNLVRIDRDMLGDLYQEFLPGDQRKKLGEFYTPIEVVDYILKHAEWPASGKLLDPACGSGTFLVRAASARLKHLEGRGIGAVERLNALQEIVGFDINPFAVYIAQMNLLFVALDDYLEARRNEPSYRMKPLPVFTTDALMGTLQNQVGPGLFEETADPSVEKAAAFRDAMGQYSRVVMNPPYVRNERLPAPVRPTYRLAFQDIAKGNADIFTYFLKKAVDWLAAGERMGVIVSLGAADADATLSLRKFFGLHTIERIVPLEWAEVFLANVNPMLLFVKKAPPKPKHEIIFVHGIRKLEELKKGRDKEYKISQREWLGLAPDGSWRIELTPGDMPVLEKLKQAWVNGLNHGNGGRNAGPISAEYGLALRTTGGDDQLIGDPARMVNPHPVLDGREVKAWSVEWQGRYLDYQPTKISDPKTTDFFKPPFVVLPCISLTSQAVVIEKPPKADKKPLMFRNTVMKCMGIHKNLNPHVLAAIINSKPVRYYSFLMLRCGVVQKGFSHFYANIIKSFPVPDRALKDTRYVAQLEELSRNAHAAAAEIAGWDMDVKEKLNSLEGDRLVSFAQTEGADLSAYVAPVVIDEAKVIKNQIICRGILTKIGGAEEVLEYLLLRAQFDGEHELTKEDLEKFPVPATKEMLKRCIDVLQKWSSGKPKAVGSLKAIEAEIDESALDGFVALTPGERKYILKRAQEFPLSQVLVTSVPGATTRVLGVKRWRSGERYRS